MSFKDVPKEHWAGESVERASKLGLLKGYPDGTFKPDQPVSRAETATIAMRLYDRTEDSFEDILSRIDPAIVQVEAGNILGSGTSIGGGFVLTNAHVVGKNKRVGIRWAAWGYGSHGNADYAEGPVILKAPEIDLAIVRVDIAEWMDKMPSIPLGKLNEVRRGMPILVAGSPIGLIGSVSAGIISFVGRNFNYELSDGTPVTIPDAIQVDAPINPGNSGGALVNLKGELIGVPSAKMVHEALEGLGFCIGLNTIGQAIQRAKDTGEMPMKYGNALTALFTQQGVTLA